VVSSMQDSMRQVINGIHGQEDDLASMLRKVSDQLDRHRAEFEIPTPNDVTPLNHAGAARVRHEFIAD